MFDYEVVRITICQPPPPRSRRFCFASFAAYFLVKTPKTIGCDALGGEQVGCVLPALSELYASPLWRVRAAVAEALPALVSCTLCDRLKEEVRSVVVYQVCCCAVGGVCVLFFRLRSKRCSSLGVVGGSIGFVPHVIAGSWLGV